MMRPKIHACVVLALGLVFIPFHVAAGKEQPDLATIRASLETLRKGAGIRHLKYSVKSRIIKGSHNNFLSPPRKPGKGVDVPREDVVIEPPPKERIDDFPRNRVWAKGSRVECKIEKFANGKEILAPYLVFSESAFDGKERISIAPKERIDPRAFPRDLKVPVEVHRFRLSDKSPKPEIDTSMYALFFAEGSLPAPDRPLTTISPLQPFVPESWRISGTTVLDGQECPVLASAPNAEWEHEEYTLRPDLHYVPCRWVRYHKGRPILMTALEYLPLEGLRPRLKSWNVRTYYHGELIYEDTCTVEKYENLDFVADSRFKLKPVDGMILWDLNDMNYRVVGNETDTFDTPQDANDYLERHPPRKCTATKCGQ